MQITHTHRVVFELCMCEKKERTKLFFLIVRRINRTLGVYFTLEQLRCFISKSSAPQCCVYFGAAPIPVQDAFVNPPNSYPTLRSNTVLLDYGTGVECARASEHRSTRVPGVRYLCSSSESLSVCTAPRTGCSRCRVYCNESMFRINGPRRLLPSSKNRFGRRKRRWTHVFTKTT